MGFIRLRDRSGFTLIEILITIAIMMFLFALVAVAAQRFMARARITSTKELIKRAALQLEAYHALNRNYPAPPVAADPFPDTCPYSIVVPLISDPAFWHGVNLEKRFLIGSSLDDFKLGDLDPSGRYLVDAWGNPLKYRKIGPERYLVWSYGPKQGNAAPQFHDDIGTGDYYDPNGDTFNPSGNPTREQDIYIDSATGNKYIGNNITSHDTDF